MISIIAVVDEANITHGSYFEASAKYLSGLIEGWDWDCDLHVVNSKDCSATSINNIIADVCESKPFVFIVFSHGSEKACVAGGTSYVSSSNADKFCDSLFYSTACLNARSLGPELVGKGCQTFVGFKEESYAFCNEEYKDIFLKCDLACLVSFLNKEDKKIKDAMQEAKSYYNMQIDKLDNFKDDILFKGALIENREALRLIGNTKLKRQDLNC